MNAILDNLIAKIMTPDAGTNLVCPILLKVMDNPVMSCDGNTYDKVAIERWFNEHDTSPLTNLKLENKILIPNLAIRSIISEFKENQKIALEAMIELYKMHPKFISLDEIKEKILKQYINFKDLGRIYDSCKKNNNTDIVIVIRESVILVGYYYISDKREPEFMKLFFSEEFIVDFKKNSSKSTIKILLNQDEIDDVNYINGIIHHIERLDDNSDNTQESINRISILGRFIQQLELNSSLSNFIFERLHSRERERRKRLMDKEEEEKRRILCKREKKIEIEESKNLVIMSMKEKLFSDRVKTWFSNLKKVMSDELSVSSKVQDSLTYKQACDSNNNKKDSQSSEDYIRNKMISIEKYTNNFWKDYKYSNKKLKLFSKGLKFKFKKVSWADMTIDSDSDFSDDDYMEFETSSSVSLSYADVVNSGSTNVTYSDLPTLKRDYVNSGEMSERQNRSWASMDDTDSESESESNIPVWSAVQNNGPLEITLRSLFHSESDEEDDY